MIFEFLLGEKMPPLAALCHNPNVFIAVAVVMTVEANFAVVEAWKMSFAIINGTFA